MRKYFDALTGSDFWLGWQQGLTDCQEKPKFVARILYEKGGFDRLMREYHNLATYADEHYLESPFHIDNLENFDFGYRAGAYCGFASIGFTFGLSHLIAGPICKLAVKRSRRHTFIGSGPKEKV